MQTLIKKNQHQTFTNTKLIINQLEEWRNEMEFWQLEIDYYLRLLKRRTLYSTALRTGLRYQFQLFAEEEMDDFKKELNKCLQNWILQESHSMKSIVDLYLNFEKLQEWYRQQRKQFRLLKTKALTDLIKSYPVIIF